MNTQTYRGLIDAAVFEFRLRNELPLIGEKEFKQSNDLDGIILSRQPTEVEKQINLKAVVDTFEKAQEELRKELDKLRKQLLEDALAGIITLEPEDYHTLTVNPSKTELSSFRKKLEDIYERGQGLVLQELRDQGADEIEEDLDEDEYLETVAGATASRMANDVQSRVIGTALTLAALGILGAKLISRIKDAFEELSDAYVDNAAATASHVAIGLGRDSAGEANLDLVREVYYSSVLDHSTCIPCQDADGETGDTASDIPPAPNPDCEGRGRCRCIHVYVFDTEKKGGAGSGHFGHAGRPGLVGGSSSGSGKVFYHGTTGEAWKEIKKDGLKHAVRRNYGASYYIGERAVSVFMTRSLKNATFYAHNSSNKLPNTSAPIDPQRPVYEPIILKISIPEEELHKIKVDDVDDPDQSVYFKGNIPPEWIELESKADAEIIYAVILCESEEAKGGQGSGHFGHAGRPGLVGGSSPSVGDYEGLPEEFRVPDIDITLDGYVGGGLLEEGGFEMARLALKYAWEHDDIGRNKQLNRVQHFFKEDPVTLYHVSSADISSFEERGDKAFQPFSSFTYDKDATQSLLNLLGGKGYVYELLVPKSSIGIVVDYEDEPNRDFWAEQKEVITHKPVSFENIIKGEEIKGGAGSGNFGHAGRPGLVGGSSESTARSERAKRTYKPVTKARRRQAIKNERVVAALVGGKFSGDNEPFDVTTSKYGLEVKTILPGAKNPKIKMHATSLARKVKEARVLKLKAATVVIDARQKPAQFYFRKGLGSFRLKNMERVSNTELKERLS